MAINARCRWLWCSLNARDEFTQDLYMAAGPRVRPGEFRQRVYIVMSDHSLDMDSHPEVPLVYEYTQRIGAIANPIAKQQLREVRNLSNETTTFLSAAFFWTLSVCAILFTGYTAGAPPVPERWSEVDSSQIRLHKMVHSFMCASPGSSIYCSKQWSQRLLRAAPGPPRPSRKFKIIAT